MNKQEQFKILFSTYGEPVQVDELTPDIKLKYKSQIGFYNRLDPSIYTGVIENMGFNAMATKNNIGEFIALHMGAITQLTLYAYQIFSDPDMFQDVGDVSCEKCETAIIDILKEGDIYRISELRYYPNDHRRMIVAERIAECACLILFLHEAAHIRGCHIDLLFEKFGISAYQEFNINPINAEESLLLRALELEADSVALVNSLIIWRDLAKRTGIHKVEVLGPTRSWLIATELLLYVMSVNHDKLRTNQLASHPSVLTRYLNIRSIMHKQNKKDIDLIEAFWQRENTLLPWFNKHQMSSSILDFFIEEDLEDLYYKELLELHEMMKKLQPRLETHIHNRTVRISN